MSQHEVLIVRAAVGGAVCVLLDGKIVYYEDDDRGAKNENFAASEVASRLVDVLAASSFVIEVEKADLPEDWNFDDIADAGRKQHAAAQATKLKSVMEERKVTKPQVQEDDVFYGIVEYSPRVGMKEVLWAGTSQKHGEGMLESLRKCGAYTEKQICFVRFDVGSVVECFVPKPL